MTTQPLPQALDRDTSYYTAVPPALRPAPRVACALHDTETLYATTPHNGGSWHIQIGRNDGELYDDVPHTEAAWHVRAFDRIRPRWAASIHSPLPVSDANWCTYAVEFVSHSTYRAAGAPYTEWQYRCFREIVAPWLQSLHAATPAAPELIYFGHGEVQADRSDPVDFDWSRAWLTPWLDDVQGRLYRPPLPLPPTELLMHLDDDQLKQYVLPTVWDTYPYDPSFGIASAWVSEYRQGRYRGSPASDEFDVPNMTITVQQFEFGLVTYNREDATFSWSG